MWVVEVNILGRRFTHRVGHRAEVLRVAASAPGWRLSKPRRPGAAA